MTWRTWGARAGGTVLILCLAGPVAADQAAARQADRLRLRDAIGEALQRSPLLRPSEDGVTLAVIGEELAESRFALMIAPAVALGTDRTGLAHHSAGVDVTRRLPTGTELTARFDSIGFSPALGGSRDAGFSVGLSQSLLQGFGPGSTAERRDARRRVASAERTLDESRQHVVLAVAEAYFAVVRQRRLVDSGMRALARARKLREASEARTAAGLATRLDVLRADLLVSQSEAQLETQQELLAAGLDRLKVLLGRPLTGELDVAGDDLPLHAASGVERADEAPLDALLTSALAARLDMREARERVADARYAGRVARWNLLPDVALTVNYTRRGLGSPSGPLLDELLGGWRVGVATSYSLQRSTERAAMQVTTIAERGARRTLEDLERRVEAEVRQAVRARTRAAATIGIQAKALDLAQQQLRLAEMRYARGLAGNFDVIDAESNLFQAESALVAAQVDRALAELVLARVTGRLDPERYVP